MSDALTVDYDEFCRRAVDLLDAGLWGELERRACLIFDRARFSGRIDGRDLDALGKILCEIDKRRKAAYPPPPQDDRHND